MWLRPVLCLISVSFRDKTGRKILYFRTLALNKKIMEQKQEVEKEKLKRKVWPSDLQLNVNFFLGF